MTRESFLQRLEREKAERFVQAKQQEEERQRVLDQARVERDRQDEIKRLRELAITGSEVGRFALEMLRSLDGNMYNQGSGLRYITLGKEIINHPPGSNIQIDAWAIVLQGFENGGAYIGRTYLQPKETQDREKVEAAMQLAYDDPMVVRFLHAKPDDSPAGDA